MAGGDRCGSLLFRDCSCALDEELPSDTAGRQRAGAQRAQPEAFGLGCAAAGSVDEYGLGASSLLGGGAGGDGSRASGGDAAGERSAECCAAAFVNHTPYKQKTPTRSTGSMRRT